MFMENLFKSGIRNMNKVVNLLLAGLSILYCSCGDSNADSAQHKDGVKRENQETSFFNWDGIPPLVGNKIEACPQCEHPAGIIVHRGPFNSRVPYGKLVEVDSGSSLRRSQIVQAEGERGGLIRGLYRKTLEEMQAVGGDSAYFTGEIVFKQVINEKGSVERSEILSSSTNMPKFDQEVKDLVDAVKFPKSNGKTVVTFPYRFEKTGYLRGHIDTTIGTL